MKTMTANQLRKRLKQNDVILIDVREPAEYKTECIEEAILIPLAEISCEKLPTQSRPIVVHCHSGKRSAEACRRLLAQNPDLEVYNLEGGIVAWKESGCVVENLGCSVLPVDRQTQFAAGFLAFFGVIFGSFVSSWFYALSGFVGLGLMFAGLTGWCGMAKLLAKMPWNQ